MMTWLKQGAAADAELGPFLDSVDGVTPETALTISQADCQLIKNGGSAAQKNDSTSATHLAGGHYKVPLNSTDTGTVGRMRLFVNETGALPVWRDFMVVTANVYDSLIGGSDKLDVNVEEWNATAVPSEHSVGYPVVTVKDGTGTGEIDTASGKLLLQDGAVTSAVIATDAIDGDAVAASAVAEFQSGLALASALATVNAYVDELESRLTSARAGYLDNLSGGAVALASALATVNAYVDELESRLTSARAGYLDALNSGVPLATGAITEAKFSSGGLNAIADAILKRDWTAVTGEASRSVLNALRFLRNKWTAIGATLTVTKEDDSTTAWSAALTKDSASDPITGSDPT